MPITKADIEEALKRDQDPYLGCDVVSAGMVKGIDITDEAVTVQLESGFPLARYGSELTARLGAAVATLDGAPPARFEITTRIVTHAVQKAVKPAERSWPKAPPNTWPPPRPLVRPLFSEPT